MTKWAGTRSERKAATRRAILDAALRLSADTGLAGLSLRAVAKEVGVVPTAFYRHFSSMEELGLDVPLRVPVSTLALHERQLVEIARALVHGASILVLDEPNSALNAAESERLFGVIGRLVANGTAVIHVSHRLEEVLRIADVVTVLRDGRVVTTVDAKRTSVRDLVTAIVGHRVDMGARSDWAQIPAG